MTLTINLSSETERKLLAHATATGKDVHTLVEEAIAEKIRRLPTFDEIFAPLRQEVQASGIGDEELDGLLEQAREEVWQEKKAKQSQGS
jgi:predicted transcriptional regulator